jgi:hypothetical protein
MKKTGSTGRRRRGLWWKVPLGLLLILVALVVVVWLNLSTIATRVANLKLPELLGTEASVERVVVKPLSGLAVVRGLTIAQPEGFGDGPAVELGQIMASIDIRTLGSEDGLLVESIDVKGLTVHVDKNADGVINLTRLGPPAAEGDRSQKGTTGDEPAGPVAEPEATAAGEASEDNAPFPGLRVGSLTVADVTVDYTDATTGDKPIEITLGNLDVQLFQGLLEMGETLSVELGQGAVTLEGIHIDQPAGFGDDALLDLPRVHLEIGREPFVGNVVRLERLELEGLRAHIARDTNSVLNVVRLGGGPPPPATDEGAAGGEEEAATEVEAGTESRAGVEMVQEDEADGDASGGSPVGVYLGELALKDFGVTYTDAVLAKESMDFVVTDLNLEIDDAMAFLEEIPVEASAVELNAALAQGDLPAAPLTLLARVGPMGSGVPDVNAQARFSGFMLDTVGPLIPPGVRETLGAEGLGLELRLALTEDAIDLAGEAITDKGHDYPVRVRGPLSKPEINLGIFGAVAGRLTGGVFNLAGGTAGAAADVAKGATEGAADLAKGAGDVVGKMGLGLFSTAKAAVTLDLDEVGNGVRETTVGAVQEAGDAVASTTDDLVDTAKEGVRSVKGDKATMKWLEGTRERHAEGVATARAALENMPFPPTPLEDP